MGKIMWFTGSAIRGSFIFFVVVAVAFLLLRPLLTISQFRYINLCETR